MTIRQFLKSFGRSFVAAMALSGVVTGSVALSLGLGFDRFLTASAQDNDLGDLKITYRPAKQGQLQPVQLTLERSRLFEGVVTDLNKTLSLPTDITVEFLECGSADAYYDGEHIGICYELVQRYSDRFAAKSGNPETAALHAGLFTLFHELGHALIDQWKLPVTGREEDAVDEFAAIMLLWANQGDAALAGAEQFAADAEDWDPLPFWDDHGLDMQRFYNVVCLVYGRDPETSANLVGEDWLPKERAELCPAEYAHKSYAWGRLLGPYLKQPIALSVPAPPRPWSTARSRKGSIK